MQLVVKFADVVIPLSILILSMAILALISRYVIKYVEDLIELTGLSETSIGFVLLSVITSTPELVIAVFAILSGTPALSVGDLLGSNVFNVGIVVGTLMVTTGFLRECPKGLHEVADILLLSSLIPLVLVIFRTPTPIIGAGLLATFVLSVYRETKTQDTASVLDSPNKDTSRVNKTLTLTKIFVGTLILIVSARFTVASALEVTTELGINPILVGALVVAFGTSLPELSLGLMAVRRGRVRLATANAIGSNLTNLTLILGVVFLSSAVSPFNMDMTVFLEIISFVLITSLIVWYYMIKGGDCRLYGAVLILTYIIFQVVVFAR